jgi:hypothetical protein
MSWLKHFWRHFDIRVSRVDIRPRAAWYAYIALGAVLALAFVLLLYVLGQRLHPPETQDIDHLRARLEELESQVAQDDSALANLEITHGANRQLADELRLLSDEQAVLKDDLAYFLRLVPVGAREGDVRLDRFVLRPETATASGVTPQRYRFSVLAGYHTGRQTMEFSGALKFVLTVEREGKTLQRVWPADKKAADLPEYQVRTRQWERKAGVLEIAPGDVLKKVELRLMQDNNVRAVTSVIF